MVTRQIRGPAAALCGVRPLGSTPSFSSPCPAIQVQVYEDERIHLIGPYVGIKDHLSARSPGKETTFSENLGCVILAAIARPSPRREKKE